eukprot:scaffold8.g1498.t1
MLASACTIATAAPCSSSRTHAPPNQVFKSGSSAAFARPARLLVARRQPHLFTAASSSSTYSRDVSSQPRLIQHKNEAKFFYAFLSQVYDYIVNPGHWTKPMRAEALAPAGLSPEQKVVDVGGGTGFCTQGVVAAGVPPANITLLDQSPHQLAKARKKADLQGVTILEGDAEDLPFPADSFDRYVSAGSIEYWPEPQRGICEAYRVLKPGGLACMIGPVHPTHPISRFFADVWMLFPTEEQYIEWFTKAGFRDVKLHRIGPSWYRGVRRHGLIMGCSVTGVKPEAGASPLELGPKAEVSEQLNTNLLAFALRVLLGSAAGFYYFLLPFYMWPAVLLLCALAAASPSAVASGAPLPPPEATLSVSLNGPRRPISPLLHGVFFEEIEHAGDGGLYAEMTQDRSFDAVATAAGFLASPATRLPVDLLALAAGRRPADRPWAPPPGLLGAANATHGAKARGAGTRGAGPNDLAVAWLPWPGGATETTLSKEGALNARNPVFMELQLGGANGLAGAIAGLVNLGYWGVPAEAGHSLTASLYMRLIGPEPLAPLNVTVALVPTSAPAAATAPAFLASAPFSVGAGRWQRYVVELVPSATDPGARLAVLFSGTARLAVDVVSLFPTANARRGAGVAPHAGAGNSSGGAANPWPFREDLLEAVKALRPRQANGGSSMRCYVEGDWLRYAFRWKEALGPIEERPGHYNSMWGYWSTDGLGLYEYLLLAEELGAEPIWVVNNGIAHGDQGCGLPWDPPNPNYKPFFLSNYIAFYAALTAAHPAIRLITSCDLGQLAPVQAWEYHVYTNPADMWSRRHAFDGMTPAGNKLVLASEYAVTDGGGSGNLIGAVAEAGFMLGLEANSAAPGAPSAVLGGSYAPLFVNANARTWPTNMIVFDNRCWFGIPSYHVQRMLASHAGLAGLPVNFAAQPAMVHVTLQGGTALAPAPRGTAQLTMLSSERPEDENSFAAPQRVSPRTVELDVSLPAFSLPLDAWAALEAALKESRIIGDLVDGIVDGGGVELSVVYAGKAAVHGNLLTPEETAVAPAVAISGAAPDALHTLARRPRPRAPALPLRLPQSVPATGCSTGWTPDWPLPAVALVPNNRSTPTPTLRTPPTPSARSGCTGEPPCKPRVREQHACTQAQPRSFLGAPPRPRQRCWVACRLVTNIPGGDFAKGDEVAGHYGPVPPTGTHRYVFLLFQQPGRIEVADPSGGERSRRAHFSSKKLAVAHGLGDPVDVK